MSVDPHEFRRCLSRFATGVTVVSCRAGGRTHGATVNAFVAVSLEPPLVLVSLDRRSKVCEYLRGQPFAVTVLGDTARDTALHFAGRPLTHLAIEWDDRGETPQVAGGIASFACAPWAQYDGGDHVLFVGRVLRYHTAADRSPLLFFAGAFRSLGAYPGGEPWLETLDSPAVGVSWRLHRVSESRGENQR